MSAKAKRISVLLIIFVFFTFLFTACSNNNATNEGNNTEINNNNETTNNSENNTSENAENKEKEEIKLTFWNGFTGSDGEVLREIVEDFNEKNKGDYKVEMDIMPWDTYFQKLPPAIATETAPSFVLMGLENIPGYVSNDSLKSMDDFYSVMDINQDNFVKEVLDMYKYNGEYYMTPMQYNLFYLYWNKDLFQEAGLDPENPPETWEELGEYAIQLTDSTKNQYGFGLAKEEVLPELIWGNGGAFWDIDKKKSLINSQENIESYKWMKDLVVNKKISPTETTGAEMDTLLRSENIAMYISGPWQINGLREENINFGITAIPAGKEGQYARIGGCGYAIPSCSDDKEVKGAYEFAKFWLSKDILKKWTVENGFPPFSYEVIEDEEVKNDEIQKNIAPLGNLARNYNNKMVVGSQLDQEAVRPIVQSIMLDAIEVEEGLAEAEEKINEIFSNIK